MPGPIDSAGPRFSTNPIAAPASPPGQPRVGPPGQDVPEGGPPHDHGGGHFHGHFDELALNPDGPGGSIDFEGDIPPPDGDADSRPMEALDGKLQNAKIKHEGVTGTASVTPEGVFVTDEHGNKYQVTSPPELVAAIAAAVKACPDGEHVQVTVKGDHTPERTLIGPNGPISMPDTIKADSVEMETTPSFSKKLPPDPIQL